MNLSLIDRFRIKLASVILGHRLWKQFLDEMIIRGIIKDRTPK